FEPAEQAGTSAPHPGGRAPHGVEKPPRMTAASAISVAAQHSPGEVLTSLESSRSGLSAVEAAHRLASTGPNALRTHRASAWSVLARQLKSPILALLIVTAVASLFLGDEANSIVTAVILVVSIALGFINEYRAERASEALHSRVSHRVVVVRDDALVEIDVLELVPGDIVHLALGSVVPADIRLLNCNNLLCDEGIPPVNPCPRRKTPRRCVQTRRWQRRRRARSWAPSCRAAQGSGWSSRPEVRPNSARSRWGWGSGSPR